MYIGDAIVSLRRQKGVLENQLAIHGAAWAPPAVVTQTENLQRVLTALDEIRDLHARGEDMTERLGKVVRFCQTYGFPVGSIELERTEEEAL